MEIHLADSRSSWENAERSQFPMLDLNVLLRKGGFVKGLVFFCSGFWARLDL